MRWKPVAAGVLVAVVGFGLQILARRLDAATGGVIQLPSFFFVPVLLALGASTAWIWWIPTDSPLRDGAFLTGTAGLGVFAFGVAPLSTSLTVSHRFYGLAAVGGVLVIALFIATWTGVWAGAGALVARATVAMRQRRWSRVA